jgi:hypothetical protein
MNWMSIFNSTASRYGLQEDLQQEVVVAMLEAEKMGLCNREARNYVAKCLHQLMKAYGIRKVNNRYEKVEIPMSSLYFGGEGNEMV